MSNLKPLKAALYVRVSTEEQKKKGYSLRGQEEELREYAKHKGYEVYDVYIDGGYSGKDFNRPDVQRMFRDMSKKKFDVIIVWKVDRISRSNKDVLSLIDDELKPRDMKLLVKTCDIDSSTTNGYMFISLLGTFAEYERAVIIERVNAGMEKKAKEGKWNGGKVLGYDINAEKQLKINKEESKVVKEIFNMRAEGLGYGKIADILNERGKKTKFDNYFSIPAIKLILENEVYIGNKIWGKYRNYSDKRRSGKSDNPVRADNSHKAIIEIDLWNKVQVISEIHNNTYSNNRNFNGDFFLTGLLKCPQCGAGTVMSKTKKRNGTGYHTYYMCQAHHSKGKTVCKSNLIKQEIVESQVLESIKGIINTPTIVNEVLSKLETEKNNNFIELADDLKILKQDLNKQKANQFNLDEKLINGDNSLKMEHYNRISDQIQNRIKELETYIENIERKIERSKSNYTISRDIILDALTNFNTLFDKANSEEKRLLIRSLIKKIEMEKDRKNIKSITFWFSEGNASIMTNDLPSNKVGRTVP